MSFFPKTAAVLGLGKSGRAAIALLQTRGTRITAFDEKPAEAPPGVETKIGPLPARFFEGQDVVVVSPGIPLSKPELVAAKAAGTEVIGEIELAFRCLPEGTGPILAVTGTNGKSTTTALLGELCVQGGKKTFVGGNLGRPFAEACAEKYDLHVIELSSFMLEGISKASFRGAALLNLTPDHLDRYPSHDAYGDAKGRIFLNAPRNGFAVVNGDDFDTIRLSRVAKVPTYAFSLDARRTNPGFSGLVIGDGDAFTMLFGNQPSFTVRNKALRGAHNLQNAMAAATLAKLAGIEDAAIQRGLDSYPGLPHRLEFVRELDGVEWINDSKATNVDSSLVALNAFPSKIWLIAGGKGKGAPYAPLVAAAKGKVLGVLTVGEDANAIADSFGSGFTVHACGTIEAAVAKARSLAKASDTVLLSPACASYDQFNNFEHRGESFKALVKALK
jgi:UDP-N-acetylmuramoylalanine--D-glutamate ligase